VLLFLGKDYVETIVLKPAINNKMLQGSKTAKKCYTFFEWPSLKQNQTPLYGRPIINLSYKSGS